MSIFNKKKHSGSNLQTLILSIVIAIAVWVAVNYVNDPDTTTTVSGLTVHFSGESILRDHGLVITGKSQVPAGSVVISGKRKDLMNGMDLVSLQVDVSDITETGDYSRQGTISLPTSKIGVEKEKYGYIPFKVEKLSEKEIPIKIRQNGSIKDKLVESEPETETVKITGSQEELDSVSYGIVDVNISELPEDGIMHLKYLLLNQSGGYIEKNETVESVMSEITVRNTVYNKKTLPIRAELTDEMKTHYRLNEDKCVLSAENADVGIMSYNNDDHITVYIDKFSTDTVEYQLHATDGMYIPSVHKKIRVKADMTPITTKNVAMTPAVENQGEGVEVSVGSIEISVSGEEDKLNASNVHTSVDVKDLPAGNYSLPVKISGDGIEVKNEYYALVTITSK